MWFDINNFHMRDERWRFILNHTKFEVFETLRKIQIFLKWTLWVMLFYKTECGHGKMTWEMTFLIVPVNAGHQNYFESEWLIIILYNYYHAKSVFRWEYLQKLLKPVHDCLKEEGRNFLLMTLIYQLKVY